MGFSKLLRDIGRESQPVRTESSFSVLDREEFETHLAISRYRRFWLTDAIRPSYDLRVVPEEGYRHDTYSDKSLGIFIPVLIAAVSKERLFETFLDLLDSLGAVVDVVLESSHRREERGHVDYLREGIDLPVLKSILFDFEDLLLNDGCTGIAVLNPRIPHEVQFDEHKLLRVYGEQTRESETVFWRQRVVPNKSLHFLTEAEHVHSSKGAYRKNFDALRRALGMDF